MSQMVYANEEFYKENYLLGRPPKLPLSEYGFWAKAAQNHIDYYTLNRISEEILQQHGEKIGQCTCELAEFLYMNEGSENKQSESISGRSISYIRGVEYVICQRHLSMTGLLYRGSNYVSKRRSEDNNNNL